MKKFLAALVVLTTMSFSPGFAKTIPDPRDIKVSPIVQESLKKQFPDADNVQWQKIGDYYVASFKHEMQRFSVYFDENGGVYSTTRFISTDALPMNALKSVKERYEVTDNDLSAMEVSKESRTYYLLSFIKNGKSFIIQSDASGSLQVVKRQKVG